NSRPASSPPADARATGVARAQPRLQSRAMAVKFPLPDWNQLAGADDARLPLLATALLIARDEYPGLDADLYDTLLQSHAEALRGEVEAIDPWPLKMAA